MPLGLSDYLILAVVALPYGLIILGGLHGSSTKVQVRRAQAEGRYRIVEVKGKRYHCIGKLETIVRTKSGRGRAILVSAGRERDPVGVSNGRTIMQSRWIKIRSITSKGLSERERWVSASGWSVSGQQEIEYHMPIK